jgi:ectoine hydroxylase-related dioxygenase (phytanoyl-CoA dioxygenase family)
MDIIEQLKTFGYAVQPDAIDPLTCARYADELDDLEQSHCTYDNGGFQSVAYDFYREKPDIFLQLVDADPLFPVVQQVLSKGEQITLRSMNASRSVKTENSLGSAGGIHFDAYSPAQSFANTDTVLAIICLDDFTAESGATYIWPYSHLSGTGPPANIGADSLPGSVQIHAKRGSILYYLGQTWHAIGKNLSGQRRWGIVSTYTYWWIKPAFDLTQCGPEIYERLSTRQKGLLGFNTRPPASAEIRINTVTKAEELPDEYAAAMKPDYTFAQDMPRLPKKKG